MSAYVRTWCAAGGRDPAAEFAREHRVFRLRAAVDAATVWPGALLAHCAQAKLRRAGTGLADGRRRRHALGACNVSHRLSAALALNNERTASRLVSAIFGLSHRTALAAAV